MKDYPVSKDLVLVGGGHSHLHVLKAFGMNPIAGLRITLVSRELMAPYSGMLPGFIAGHYHFNDAHIDLLPLARFAGARFFHDEVTGLELDGRRLLCRQRPPLHFDLLSLDVGSTPALPAGSRADPTLTPVKPIDSFVSRWERAVARIVDNDRQQDIAVVGAGAAGVELVLAIHYRLHNLLREKGQDPARLQFHLFSDQSMILPAYSASVRKRFEGVLAARGIRVHRDKHITGSDGEKLYAEDGSSYFYDEVFWATSATAQAWLAESGLAVNGGGFVKVADTLESVSHRDVFAAGDVASMVNHPRPKSGVYAVRQGPPLYGNLRRRLLHKKLKPFTPQKKHLSLISTGERHAVASRNGGSMAGPLIWRWKDWIDRRFMDKYRDLERQPMDAAKTLLPELKTALSDDKDDAMRCGGCGGKLGAGTLDAVLAQLPRQSSAVLVTGLDHPDDAAVVQVPEGKLQVHTIDFFREFVDDPWLFGQIAANHALNDIFAMGAEAVMAMATVTLPHGEEHRKQEQLLAMLLGAVEVLNEAGAVLVGGHSGEAAEVSLGFAITGQVKKAALLEKRGMRAGDALVLTKPLGTGTLFAADMRGRARGRWISAALTQMLRSNRRAVDCLAEHGSHACTDVSGFGLLGHLLEMLRDTQLKAELRAGAIPCLDGAMESMAAGIFSSLYPANRQKEVYINGLDEISAKEPPIKSFPQGGRDQNSPNTILPLLSDPQTAGGLLASMPSEHAADCVQALKGLGYEQAAIIGELVDSKDGEHPVSLLN